MQEPKSQRQILTEIVEEYTQTLLDNIVSYDIEHAREEGREEGYKQGRFEVVAEEQAIQAIRAKLQDAQTAGNEVEISTTVGGSYKGIVEEVGERIVTVRPAMLGLVRKDTIQLAGIIAMSVIPHAE